MKIKPLSFGEKLSFGAGDVANCITFGFTAAYLSYYYTDIIGISVAAVGFILGVARILEAFANIGTGIAIDRTDTRWGKTKPFLYTTTIPLMLFFFLMLMVPDLSMTGMTIFAFVTYLTFCLLYAVNNTAYGTLLSMMTGDVHQRRSINNFKLIGIGVGNVIATACTLPLAAFFGGGRKGYLFAGLLYALVSVVLLMDCSLVCKERIQVHSGKTKVSGEIKNALKSRSWIALCALALFVTCAQMLRTTSIVYYAKYVLDNENLATVILATSPLSMLVISPFVGHILDKAGNRKAMMAGCVGMLVSIGGMLVSGTSVPGQVVFNFIFGIFSCICTGPMYASCSDTMDEVEYLTGERPQGIMTSIMMCTCKLGIAFAPIIASAVLKWGGYVAGQVQSQAAVRAINLNMFWFPAVFILLGMLSAAFFDLDQKHEEILRKLGR